MYLHTDAMSIGRTRAGPERGRQPTLQAVKSSTGSGHHARIRQRNDRQMFSEWDWVENCSTIREVGGARWRFARSYCRRKYLFGIEITDAAQAR